MWDGIQGRCYGAQIGVNLTGVHTMFLLADASVSTPYARYLLLGVMGLMAVGFACAPLILSAILAPKKPG